MFNWLYIVLLLACKGGDHPLFMSVTEIGHNAAGQSLEVSCKLFTDDFETALRRQYNKHIDLLDARTHAAVDVFVRDYTTKHLAIRVDGKLVNLEYLGFDQQEEGTISYYEVKHVAKPNHIEVINNLLYEDKPQQMGIIHVMVNGRRTSTRLINPEDTAGFRF